MSISKSIVEAHGGGIWAPMNGGSGAHFTSYCLRQRKKQSSRYCHLIPLLGTLVHQSRAILQKIANALTHAENWCEASELPIGRGHQFHPTEYLVFHICAEYQLQVLVLPSIGCILEDVLQEDRIGQHQATGTASID